jgi:hypothetical protein
MFHFSSTALFVHAWLCRVCCGSGQIRLQQAFDRKGLLSFLWLSGQADNDRKPTILESGADTTIILA